jgi:anti-sigma regulatory factor (Ser/Thr protein kinase)
MNDEQTTLTAAPSGGAPGFRHTLYPYDGDSGFLAGALAFIDDAVTGGEAVVVAVAEPKQQILRERLAGLGSSRAGADGPGPAVSFLDVAALGRNPGRLIPAWQDWIAERAVDGRAVRGIGESAWGGPDQVLAAELHYHEWLLNRAFADSPAWWLLCPYDTTVLEPKVLEAAGRCHPLTLTDGALSPSSGYSDDPYEFEQLPSPCDPHNVMAYTQGDLAAVREKVSACACELGVCGESLQGLLVAATEVAANSVRHGGGGGTLRTWSTDSWFVCEFHDSGYISDPLAGRVRPALGQIGGHGLWLTQQLCDLVQIRSTPDEGTTIRLHTSI